MEKNKNLFNLHIETNALIDEGEGVLRFNSPLTITDGSEQYNGTRYDIPSMDLSEYKGHITANHSERIEEIVGKVVGITKDATQITIDGIRFALKENALARYVHDMILGGFITDFSIETIGPSPDDEGIYRNAKLVGLSVVVLGNNRSATLNKLAHDCIEGAESDGLDTSSLKDILSIENSLEGGENMQFVTIKNNKAYPVTVKYTNASGEKVEKELDPEETVDVSEDQEEAVVEQIESTEEPVVGSPEETPAEGADNSTLNTILSKMEKLERQVFSNSAKEPEFKKAAQAKVSNELGSMNWRERHGKQINLAWDYLKKNSQEALRKLTDINKYHLERLQEKGVVSNAITLSDMGNFVISDEMLSEIEGHRSNYRTLLDASDWRETLSLQMAWLKRDGDVNMQEVEMCDDDADGNLKPISEYEATIQTANLHELAAVTPVCNAATRFLAADLLGDIATGYRTDYDRKRAQLMIARLEQAVDSTGNSITYTTDSDANSLEAFINTWSEASEEIMNGVFIMSSQSYGELVRRLVGAGVSGPLAGVFTTGEQGMILGKSYIIVPNDLLPALNTAGTRSFTIEGASVTINHAVFYVDLSTFTGRTSGGLQFDLSTEAAYEDGETVKSAFQRNELVLRGSFFRNGAVKDEDKVVGLLAPGVS